MPKLVKNESVSEDICVFLESEQVTASLTDIKSEQIIPLGDFIEGIATVKETVTYAVWLAAADDVNLLADYLDKIHLVVLKVDNFMDGRCFSQSRILRDHMDFKGDIRVAGNTIQDQVYYLARCGVSSFSVADDINIESLQKSLNDFSESYQAACDEPQPLFRRRV